MAPRGIRNHNPGNLRRTPDKWKGLAAEQSDDEFFTFIEPQYGLRALARLLQVYQEVHNLKTVREIINRWAPPNENDTSAYIQAVSIWTDIEPDEPIDVTQFETSMALAKAIVRMENGKPPEGLPLAWYEDDVYEKALRLAGVSPKKRLSQSRTTQGTAVAGTATASAIAVLTDTFGLSPEIAGLLPTALASLSQETTSVILLGIGFAGALYALYARVDDHKQGRL